jgi:hypothetical protein
VVEWRCVNSTANFWNLMEDGETICIMNWYDITREADFHIYGIELSVEAFYADIEAAKADILKITLELQQ